MWLFFLNQVLEFCPKRTAQRIRGAFDVIKGDHSPLYNICRIGFIYHRITRCQLVGLPYYIDYKIFLLELYLFLGLAFKKPLSFPIFT